jgi:hypothetical protein
MRTEPSLEPESAGEIEELTEIPLRESPGREELVSATDVMSALVKAAKGLRMYLANNPMLIKFVEDAVCRIAAHLERFGDYKLEVSVFSLHYQGTEVYQSQDPKESLAYRLHSDGIRYLLLSQGLTEGELVRFLEIVGFERPNSNDDDIVTRLWGSDLPHISYLLEEDFVEFDTDEDPALQASQQAALSEVLRSLAASPLPPPRMFPAKLLLLTPEEETWLRGAVQADARRDALEDVIHVLSATLSGVKNPAVFRDYCAIAVKLANDLLLAKDVGHALGVIRFLDQLPALRNLPVDLRRLITGSLAGVLDETVLQTLQEAIDDGVSVSPEQLRELLLIFGLPSLGAICELLGRVEKLKMRKVVIEVLIELGKDRPEVFAPFLADPRWYLVRNVVLVLALLGNPVSLQMIAGLITHKEARIRKEVLNFLEHTAESKARPYILKFLRDPSGPLRIRALQILGREKLSFAFKPVLALTAGEEFKAWPTAEKKVVYETLGEIGSERVVPLFREMLLKKQWFRRPVPKESAICAVAGLLKVRHGSALALLKEARSQGNPEIRAIINQAIEAAADTGKTAA